MRKKIEDIVNENYVHGAVLYYFGITFYDYFEKSLDEACAERGLDAAVVIKGLESINDENGISSEVLQKYPVELIIEYLKHTHHIFVKDRLPYLATLIEDLPGLSGLERDLKFVFPLFVEDFIHHIYQEEDTLFDYVHQLQRFKSGKVKPGRMYFAMEKNALQSFAMEHQEHDDEMLGIRKLTNNYRVPAEASLHMKVVFAELQRLEKELIIHADIENDILFPKALMIEQEVRTALSMNIPLN